jgi:hypothetical protein
MKKYLVECQTVKAEPYKEGMEDGYRIYYWFPPDKDGFVVKAYITFDDKDLKEKWKKKRKKSGIQMSEDIPVIETDRAVVEVCHDDYIVFTASNKKLVMNSEAFDCLFEEIQ